MKSESTDATISITISSITNDMMSITVMTIENERLMSAGKMGDMKTRVTRGKSRLLPSEYMTRADENDAAEEMYGEKSKKRITCL